MFHSVGNKITTNNLLRYNFQVRMYSLIGNTVMGNGRQPPSPRFPRKVKVDRRNTRTADTITLHDFYPSFRFALQLLSSLRRYYGYYFTVQVTVVTAFAVYFRPTDGRGCRRYVCRSPRGRRAGGEGWLRKLAGPGGVPMSGSDGNIVRR